MDGNGDGDDRHWPPEATTEHEDQFGIDRDRNAEDSRGADRPTVDLQDEDERATAGPDRDPGPNGEGDPSGSPTPDENTVRVWTALVASLAVITLGTAGSIAVAYDASSAVAGAIVLAVGFGAIAIAGRRRPVLFGYLDDAWAEHRLYVWFSTGLFALGIAGGVLLFAAGVDLTDLFLEMLEEEFGEEFSDTDGELDGEGFELSASFFIMNNTPPFLAAVVGGFLFGLIPFVIMVFNGVLVGNIVAVTGSDAGLGVILALLVPHGIFELPALFIAAGVGFRFLHRIGQRFLGTRDAVFAKAYFLRTTALVGFAWLLLVLAAFVEAYVTFLIAEALVGA